MESVSGGHGVYMHWLVLFRVFKSFFIVPIHMMMCNANS